MKMVAFFLCIHRLMAIDGFHLGLKHYNRLAVLPSRNTQVLD